MFKEFLANDFEAQDLVELCRDWLITLTPAESKFSTSTAAKVQLDLSKVDKPNQISGKLLINILAHR